MTETNEKVGKLQQLLKQKKSKAFYASQLNVTVEQIDKLLRILKGEKQTPLDKNKKKAEFKSDGTASLEYEGNQSITSLQQAIEFFKIDTTKWEVERWVCNSYDVSSKWRDQDLEWVDGVMNGTAVRKNEWINKTNYQVKVWLKQVKSFSEDRFTEFLKNYTPKPIKIEQIHISEFKKDLVDVEISIADFHLDRKVLAGDTLESRKQEFRNLVHGLITKATACYDIDKLVFVVGNDWFNTDNYHNQTTNLTPQEVSVSWDKAYEEGFDLLVETIVKLKHSVKGLEIVLVQGNHDRTKSFYLTHALEVFFKPYKNISFQRENSNTKFVVLGNTFIGYHHGNHIKINDLPLYFAHDHKSRKAYGNAEYKEVHTGDKHHYMAKDVQTVRIQQIPSMVKPDNYTNDGLYLHIKAGIAFCYDKIKGRVAEFEHRL